MKLVNYKYWIAVFWYAFVLSAAMKLLVDYGYLQELTVFNRFMVYLGTFVLGDVAITRYEKKKSAWAIRKEVIKRMKEQGLNPKDYKVKVAMRDKDNAKIIIEAKDREKQG